MSSTATATRTTMRWRHARPLAASLAITSAGVLPGFLVSAMAIQLRSELAVTPSSFGLMLAAFFATGGLGSPVGGRIADRLGWRRGVWVCGMLSTVTLLGFAVLVDSPALLLGFLVLGGCALAITGPTGNLVLAREMPGHRLGLVFGIKQSAIPIATMFAGFALPVIALTVGWRWAFVAAAAFPIAAIATSGPPGGRHGPATTGPAGPTTRRAGGRGLVLLALGGGLTMTAAGGMAAFLVTSAVDLGISEGTAGALYAFASLAGLLVRVVAGAVADRTRASGFRAVGVMMTLGGVGYAILALRSPPLLAVGTVLAFGCGWAWAGLMNYGIVRTYPDQPAGATGTVQFGTTIGVAAGPIVLGVMAEHAGYRAMWLVAAALALAGATVVVLARLSLPRPDARERP